MANVAAPFSGFPRETLSFLRDLQEHNDRDWFQAHKAEYTSAVEEPSKCFLQAMTRSLEAAYRMEIQGKIFRIHRDVRFSKDKSPYNAFIRLAFSDARAGGDCEGEVPKWFFSLEPEKLILGAGIWEFSKDLLTRYRAALLDEIRGSEIARLVGERVAEGARLHEPALKRVPAGIDPNHPRELLLRGKGLAIWWETPPPEELFAPGAAGYCLREIERFAPIYQWLTKL